MELKWTSKALSDLARLYDFLVLASKPAAARTVQSLTQAPVILLTHPRMGEQLCVFRSIRSRIGIEVRSAIRIHSINRELNFFYRFLTRFFAAFHYRGIFPQ